MNIEFIKWMCEKAEGFYIHDNCLRVSGEKTFTECLMGYFDYAHVYYPLLLQRAFREVANDKEIVDDHITLMRIFKEGDKAVEQYLKYIWEQEKGK